MKDYQINIRLTEGEYKELQDTLKIISKKTGFNVSMSQMIRSFLNAGIEENKEE